jgi:predicted nucleic acid-binding Zn ribbon protein
MSLAVTALADRVAPATPLAQIQRVWPQAVGELIAREATPTSERGGVLTVTCVSSVWAQELDLMSADVVAKLNRAVGAEIVTSLRCTASAPRSWARSDAR